MKNNKLSGFEDVKQQNVCNIYERRIFNGLLRNSLTREQIKRIKVPEPGDWANKVYCKSSTDMAEIPGNSIALAFTSPPYSVGKEFEKDWSMEEYLSLISRVGKEVYRVLKPGGKYIIDITNIGRRPYLPLTAFYYQVHLKLGFLPMGEFIWQKSEKAFNTCPCKKWPGAKSPCWCQMHEYIMIFAKQSFSRLEEGKSEISEKDFMKYKSSVWTIKPVWEKYVGHPTPFPVELAARIIKMFSFEGEVVLDPFMGSGTTCAAAVLNKRLYVGYELLEKYCRLAGQRIKKAEARMKNSLES